MHESLDVFRTLRSLTCCAGVALRKGKSVKTLINLRLFRTKTANSSVMAISTIVFGLLIIKRNVDCATPGARVKVEELDFSNTSITVYTSHLSGGRRVMSDSPLCNITCVCNDHVDIHYSQSTMI